jgi:ribonucleoside-diphosphate reductase alpha chain
MTRQRLRNRRLSEIFTIELHSLRYTATFSRFDGGGVGEVFIQNTKPGSQSDCYARDAAIAASLALQFGCPLQTLRRALLRDPERQPQTPLAVALDRIAELETAS